MTAGSGFHIFSPGEAIIRARWKNKIWMRENYNNRPDVIQKRKDKKKWLEPERVEYHKRYCSTEEYKYYRKMHWKVYRHSLTVKEYNERHAEQKRERQQNWYYNQNGDAKREFGPDAPREILELKSLQLKLKRKIRHEKSLPAT